MTDKVSLVFLNKVIVSERLNGQSKDFIAGLQP
jgi:hypothetical protein